VRAPFKLLVEQLRSGKPALVAAPAMSLRTAHSSHAPIYRGCEE
jgi:hypothetical protein